MRKSAMLVAASLLLSAPAAQAAPKLEPEAKLARMLEGRVAGEPVNCISFRDIRSTEIVDDTAIVYRVGRTLYVNRPRGGAGSLDRDDVLVTRTTQSRLCSIDVVHLYDSASRIQSGFVSLGEFVPYERPRR